MIHVGYFFISSALWFSDCWPAASITSSSYAKKTGWKGEFLLSVSMSVDDRLSDAIGSAGTGTASRTGSGGPGGRPEVVELVAGGGLVGRATGGFFFPHAPTSASATIIATTTLRLCFIVCPCAVHISHCSRGPTSSDAPEAPAPALPLRALRSAAAEGSQALSLGGFREPPRRAAYCDQFGYLFMPWRVTCRRFLPSRSMRKICSLPARVDVNARCRPFGENAGLSLLPTPSVTVFDVRVAKSKILMS